jgi:hypothetical protein
MLFDSGIRFRVQGSGFKVQGSGFKVQGSGFRVQGSGFKVQGSGFKVYPSLAAPKATRVQRLQPMDTARNIDQNLTYPSYPIG